MSVIPLTKLQKEIMSEFYKINSTKVIYNKNKRKELWSKSISHARNINLDEIKNQCPAIEHQIRKSFESGNNIQSAVFSECVYAQTLANMLGLNLFVNCYDESRFIPKSILSLLDSYHLIPRYVYSTKDKSRMLIQAGGCGGIDSALITVIDLNIFTIEFKEPEAKTSEPDLPKYEEDGKLKITDDFKERYPQFIEMLREQETLNFFENMGRNIHNFSKESINIAVSNNYTKKYADVICTEDKNGILTMIPSNQVALWAEIEGEIRPAGRNHYNVWTPRALKYFLELLEARIVNNAVYLQKSKLDIRKQRGGAGRISGYKITPLFFVYASDCKEENGELVFDISKVQQLNPTVAGKVFFKTLEHADVKKYYEKLF